MRFILATICGGYTRATYAWKLENEQKPNVGDFAIVENRDGFAMVEIVATGETGENESRKIVPYGISKSVRYIVPKEYLEGRK